ncbi:hypothetical protein O0L34_g16770 [Tuta absoluta]|nr:hypothetical protein O0L34_g16770 [Tuta absoluta]
MPPYTEHTRRKLNTTRVVRSGAAASPHGDSGRYAATAFSVRHRVREPGIHFLIAWRAHARSRRAAAPPACSSARLARLARTGAIAAKPHSHSQHVIMTTSAV